MTCKGIAHFFTDFYRFYVMYGTLIFSKRDNYKPRFPYHFLISMDIQNKEDSTAS